MKTNEKTYKSLYLAPLFGGGVAAVCAGTAVYPLDTLKTRLQAAEGFKKAGGFHGVYRGLMTALTSTAATHSLFFVCYETIKDISEPLTPAKYIPIVHVFAAGFCEVVSCLVRVPTEVAKQRQQTFIGGKNKSALAILVDAYKKEGLRRGVYRGFYSTVLRDLPFTLIKVPVWELLKNTVKKYNNGEVSSFQSGLCGALSGAFATVITAPFDLAKTRIILASTSGKSDDAKRLSVPRVLRSIYMETGFRGLFAGITPRLGMMVLGGLVFFGFYDETKKRFEEFLDN